jgi:hypothetical protein
MKGIYHRGHREKQIGMGGFPHASKSDGIASNYSFLCVLCGENFPSDVQDRRYLNEIVLNSR